MGCSYKRTRHAAIPTLVAIFTVAYSNVHFWVLFPQGIPFHITEVLFCLYFLKSLFVGTSCMFTAKHQLCIRVILHDGQGGKQVLIHPVNGNIHPLFLGSTKNNRGRISLCEFGCTLVQPAFTEIVTTSLTKMLVVEQCTPVR